MGIAANCVRNRANRQRALAAARNVARNVVYAARPVTEARRARRRRQRQRKNQLYKDLRAKCGPGSGVDQNITDAFGAPGFATQGANSPALPTVEGSSQNWVLKALHPNGEEVTSVVGIPDHVSVPVVSPEFRQNVVVTSRADAADNENDDLDILILPFGDLTGLYRRYKAGTTVSDKWVPIWNPTFNVANRANDIPGKPATAGGSYTSKKIAYKVTNMNEVYGFGRKTYKGVTVHLDAPATRDQGRIMAGQVAVPYDVIDGEVYMTGWDNETKKQAHFYSIQSGYSLNTLPLDESCLMQASPGAATWEARDGVYMPMRFRDPAHQFSPSGGRNILMRSSTVSTSTSAVAIELADAANPPTGYTDKVPFLITPRMLLNGLTGVILIRGIDAKANIHIKVRTGMECQVDSCSTISPYQRMSPVLDREAIDEVAVKSQLLPQVFPASYNDFGGMISAIVGLGKKVRGKLADANLPLISPWMKFQNKYIYDPLGLNSPQRMPTMTGWHDPLKRVYDRMTRFRR